MIAEIQGLRAVAVLLVLVFHVWPDSIPGGYIGVDVFFVISGYLITGGLLRELQRDGRIRLDAFYARRARRLLPAASLVLLATLLGSLWLLPASRWQGLAVEVAASAAYVQNWLLAASSIDYWAAENAASPLQHFWSLSIEEQFYLAWPLAMLAAAGLGARRVGLRMSLAWAMGAIFLVSLAASVWLTARQPEQAYFFTHTRAWELALGGLLALLPASAEVRGTADVSAAAGLTLIAVAAFMLNTSSAFPGYLALLPVFGAALVIYAGEIRGGPARLLRSGLLRWTGDRSYSIYLWHWPLVIWYGHVSDGIDLAGGTGVILVTLLVSHYTYEYVEEPFRRAELRARRALATGAVSVGVCVLGAGVVHAMVARMEVTVPASARVTDYPGPAVLAEGLVVRGDVPPIPALSALANDVPVMRKMGCHQGQRSAEALHCVLGDPDSTQVVALVGDSHAGQWVPALERIARAEGWKLLTFTKSACPFAEFDVQIKGQPYESCREWPARVLEELPKHGVRMVITSQSRYGYVERDRVAEGLLVVWRKLPAMGIEVVAIADTPWLPFRPDDCLGSRPHAECTADRAAVVPKADPLRIAVERFDKARLIDMTDLLCTPDQCPVVVGNLVVWRDRNHITATYSAALAPYLAERLGLDQAGLRETADAELSSSQAVREMVLNMSCQGRREGDDGLELRVFARVEADLVTVVRGDFEERIRSYDFLQGRIRNGRVELTGEYSVGRGKTRPARLEGEWNDDSILLSGQRGPRSCELRRVGRENIESD